LQLLKGRKEKSAQDLFFFVCVCKIKEFGSLFLDYRIMMPHIQRLKLVENVITIIGKYLPLNAVIFFAMELELKKKKQMPGSFDFLQFFIRKILKIFLIFIAHYCVEA
jgi:hypothetical protein